MKGVCLCHYDSEARFLPNLLSAQLLVPLSKSPKGEKQFHKAEADLLQLHQFHQPQFKEVYILNQVQGSRLWENTSKLHTLLHFTCGHVVRVGSEGPYDSPKAYKSHKVFWNSGHI